MPDQACAVVSWSWRRVDAERNRVLVLNTANFTTKTEDSEAPVRVDPGLIQELEPFRAGMDEPVATPGELDEAVAWLRGKGVNGFMPLHTLRKESGSLVCEGADLLAASRHLRHGSLAIPAAVYVENRKDAAPKIGAMLQPPAKSNAKPNNVPDSPRKPVGKAGRRGG